MLLTEFPLEHALRDQQSTIEAWLHAQWLATPPPVSGSMDLRYAGFKLAPVDMNLYPAGFNNLHPTAWPRATAAVHAWLQKNYPTCQSILIIPENHSRNFFYWHSIEVLLKILRQTGRVVRVGGDTAFFPENKQITLPSGSSILIEPMQRIGRRLTVENFNPDLLWLNNDLASGVPAYLNHLEQPVCPAAELGWHRRLKSVHFGYYRQVVLDFSAVVGLDPWLFDPLFDFCDALNFMENSAQARLAQHVDRVLHAIQKKYNEHGIQQTPFVIVKADAGTYGMSVMSVNSAADIMRLNRKQRKNMAVTKGSQAVHRVIIQEGVHSIEACGAAVAEPVMYVLGQEVVGGFYRMHKNKSPTESLNTPGMEFKPFALAESKVASARDYAYQVVARLSMLAAAREQKNL